MSVTPLPNPSSGPLPTPTVETEMLRSILVEIDVAPDTGARPLSAVHRQIRPLPPKTAEDKPEGR